MSKFLEVKDYDAGEGQEHDPASYPSIGVYWCARTSMYYFNSGISIYSVYVGAEFPAVSQLPSEQSDAAPALDHIAMLAVVLHPEVASEYIKKGGAV